MEFKQHVLPYKAAKYSSTFTFELHDQTLCHDGFVRDHILPEDVEVKDRSITLSSHKDFAAIAYVRRKDDIRFLVLLSYGGGERSVSALLSPEKFQQKVAFLRSGALERLFNKEWRNHGT